MQYTCPKCGSTELNFRALLSDPPKYLATCLECNTTFKKDETHAKNPLPEEYKEI